MTPDAGIVGDWLLERDASGKARGEAKGVLIVLLIVGRKRFGEPELNLLEALESITSVGVLKQMAERLLEVESWEELMVAASPVAFDKGM
jgi:hypothetical protein